MYQKHRVVCGVYELAEPEQPIIDHGVLVRLTSFLTDEGLLTGMGQSHGRKACGGAVGKNKVKNKRPIWVLLILINEV